MLIRSIASNLKQVASLLCAKANSATYSPTLSGRVKSSSLSVGQRRPTAADWSGGMSAYRTVDATVSMGYGWPYNVLIIPINCHF